MSNFRTARVSARRRTLTATLLLTAIAGQAACTSTASSRLAAPTAAVRRVWVVACLGSFSALGPAANAGRLPGGEVSEAMRVDFSATLNRNGVPVSGYRQTARPLANVSALSALWAANRASLADTSHILVLTAQSIQNVGAGRIEYEAVLWDTDREALIWKGAPSFQTARSRPRTAEAEALAGDVLRALQRDQLVALPERFPVDAHGVEIAREWMPIRLY